MPDRPYAADLLWLAAPGWSEFFERQIEPSDLGLISLANAHVLRTERPL